MQAIPLLTTLLALPISASAEIYYCTSDKSVGFAFASTDWKPTNFGQEKYIISKVSDGYELKSAGSKNAIAQCYVPDKTEVVICNGWVNLHFSKITGRYTSMHVGSYHLVGTAIFPKGRSDIPNPSISIGTCIGI